MSGFDAITIEVDDEVGAATIFLNRPEKRNALSDELVEAMTEELKTLRHRDDIRSVLVIGSGPIVIGQGCEFDYSGVQACKALRAEGYRVVALMDEPFKGTNVKDALDASLAILTRFAARQNS